MNLNQQIIPKQLKWITVRADCEELCKDIMRQVTSKYKDKIMCREM